MRKRAWKRTALPVLFLLLSSLFVPVSADINRGVFLAAGDSITAGVDLDNAWSRGYIPYLASLLDIPESNFVNIGVGGFTSVEGLEFFRERLIEVRPQFVLILFGTNDITRNVPRNRTLEALGEMVNAARTIGTIPILGTVIPRGSSHRADPNNLDTLSLNIALINLARQLQGAGLADHFSFFLDTPCDQLACGPDDEYFFVGEDEYSLCCYYSDRLHPNQTGYQHLAQSWFEAIIARGEIPPQSGDYSAPWVVNTWPDDGEAGVDPETSIWIHLMDLGDGIDESTMFLFVDNTPIPLEELDFTGNPESLEITYSPEIPFTAGSEITIAVGAQDLAVPANTMNPYEFSFKVGNSSGQAIGDIDGSGRVDGMDLAILGYAFGSTDGSPFFIPAADLNGDGLVDGVDLAILASHFGETI